jgi:phytoene/squalene synthetase
MQPPARLYFRTLLLARNLLADRERPDLGALARIEDPERFIWAILPHAARTFSVSIALLPERAALPAAVAYLYCRMLDTYEDLVPDRAVLEAQLTAFAARFPASAGAVLQPAPPIVESAATDERDRAHLLLVQRAALVDRVYLSFDEGTRGVIADLVRDMAEGMRWASTMFAAQGGVLDGEAQLATYCGHVLGNPVVFMLRMLRLHDGEPPVLEPEQRAHAMRVGELTQLANITRDVEKDLRRGIAYDAALRADLGRDVTGDAAAVERVREVRARLLRIALRCAPSYGRMIDGMRLPRVSLVRASAVVMLLFTERYYRRCARRAGLTAWPGPDSAPGIIARGLGAGASPRRARIEVARVERAFLECAAEQP